MHYRATTNREIVAGSPTTIFSWKLVDGLQKISDLGNTEVVRNKLPRVAH